MKNQKIYFEELLIIQNTEQVQVGNIKMSYRHVRKEHENMMKEDYGNYKIISTKIFVHEVRGGKTDRNSIRIWFVQKRKRS